MKKKIVLLPLDERPCNFLYPGRLFSNEEIELVLPAALGNKKHAADTSAIRDFLLQECPDADGLILSMDMLLYGGLIPSRIHHEDREVLTERMRFLRDLRKENPSLLIYAFQVIMRCPAYSSSDEEPDYYEEYGKEIHDAGEAVHRSHLGQGTKNEVAYLLKKVDSACLDDYLSRREVNRYLNVETLQYVRDGVIDALVIPQDDSGEYGYAAMDQTSVRKKIFEYGLEDRVLMYPGADEVELTLLSRMINVFQGRCPSVYIKYASEEAASLVPLYEGAILSSTLKYHIMSAGCCLSDTAKDADIELLVTAPSSHMQEAVNCPSFRKEYCADRALPELIAFAGDQLSKGKVVTIADNAYANGGDLELIRMLDRTGLLMEVSGYAGWNTSANTIGTAIAEGVEGLYFEKGEKKKNFLLERYLEDAGYCTMVRQKVTDRLPADMNYFNVREEEGTASQMVYEGIEAFAAEYLPSLSGRIRDLVVSMPWKRMFEVNLSARYE